VGRAETAAFPVVHPPSHFTRLAISLTFPPDASGRGMGVAFGFINIVSVCPEHIIPFALEPVLSLSKGLS
jgi:hypothetical protein